MKANNSKIGATNTRAHLDTDPDLGGCQKALKASGSHVLETWMSGLQRAVRRELQMELGTIFPQFDTRKKSRHFTTEILIKLKYCVFAVNAGISLVNK